ncbi:MAG TPA: hypothetical protein VFF40_01715, partial [Acidimicrobiia bacterium]|nr:hypothetical protein [Acidimicrobiia bacterium]
VMPSDLLDVAGTASLDHPLVLTMTRDGRAGDPRVDAEYGLRRAFSLPTAREFGLAGTARLNSAAPDDVVDRSLGIPDASEGGITVTSSDHLFGDLASRGSSAVDGDPSTAWTTPLADIIGQSLRIETAGPVTIDRLDLAVANDRVHSVPKRLTITTADGEPRTVQVPDVGTQRKVGGTATTVATFPPLTGNSFTVTIEGVRAVLETDFATGEPAVMPVGIAELGLPGIQRAAMPERLADSCRTDLVAMDGDPVGVRLDGTTQAAATGGAIELRPCDGRSVALTAGDHDVRAAPGLDTGVDLDQLVWSSAAGGAATPTAATTEQPASTTSTPQLRVLSEDATSAKVHVDGATKPFWLVLGQSLNPGWTARVDGQDLGEPSLVDGFANGWEIEPLAGGGPITIDLVWEPQRVVNFAIAASMLAVVLCLGIVGVSVWRQRRRTQAVVRKAEPSFASPFATAGRRPPLRRVLVTAALTGIAAAALIQPWCGLVVGGLVALVAIRPRWRFVLTVFPVLALVGISLYMIESQIDRRWLTDIGWPGHFWRLRTLGWLALAFLAADVIVGLVRDAEPVGGGDEPPTEKPAGRADLP